MSDMLRFDPDDYWYIELGGYGSKFPSDEWGGYSQSFVASDTVHGHQQVVESDHDHWGICGCKDFDHTTLSTLIFDLDVHKAPEEFDPSRVTMPDDTLVVRSQNGGLHVYFKVHAQRGELAESDFQMSENLGWDIDIRGSSVAMHVVAPSEIPGNDSPYEVVNNDTVKTVTDPADAAERFRIDGQPLLEYNPQGRVGTGVEIDRDVQPPDEMPTCYHRGLQLRAAAPDDHPNTHKVNVLTALCGLAAGYDVETMLGHFCEEFAPGDDLDRDACEYHLKHIASSVDRGDYSPPAISTLRDFGILDEGETCTCDIDYHGSLGDSRITATEHVQQAHADGGTTAVAAGGDGEAPALSLRERVLRQVIQPLEEPADSDAETITEDVARERLADLLCDEYNFLYPREDTRGWRSVLYVYSDEDGIYEPHGESFVQQEVERLMAAWASNQRVKEIVGKIERRAGIQARRLETAPEKRVVANGILDVTTGEIEPHTPDQYHKTMIGVEYDAAAECPAIDEFLHDVVEDKDVGTLYRLIAHTLYGEYAAEKAAMLLGDGRNGKSVFLSLIEEFLGEWNVSNQSLQDLNEEDFSAYNLLGKLANVHPDMSDQTVQTMQMFKKLTGRDTVSADKKFEDHIQFENRATLLFACNRMPVLKDDTRGNWRRWLIIDFPNTFEPGAEGTVPKRELMERITTESELQGLLARCVEEIKAWDQGRDWYPNAPGWREARKRIRRAAEPMYDFAHACLDDAEDFEDTETVRKAYQAYAEQEGLPGMSREQFGKKLLSLTDYQIEKKQKRIDGRRQSVYQGITFTGRGLELANGDYSDDEDGQQDQSSFGGPQGRVSRIVRLADEHKPENGGVSEEMLIGLGVGEGMDRERAESAIQKARNQGDLMDSDNGLYPT